MAPHHIINAMRGTDKKWWEIVYGMVNDNSEKHVNRITLFGAKRGRNVGNQANVKTQLAPQPQIEPSDKVKVIIKKEFEKGYMPGWSEGLHGSTHAVP